MSEPRVLDVSRLPRHGLGLRGMAWWAAVEAVAVELTLHGLLAVIYFYLRDRAGVWPSPPGGASFTPGTLATVIVLASLVPTWLGGRAQEPRRARRSLLAMAVLGLGFVAAGAVTLSALPFTWNDHPYGSIVWVMLGLILLHGLGALLWVVLAIVRLPRSPSPGEVAASRACALHWSALAIFWLVVWAIVFLDPGKA